MKFLCVEFFFFLSFFFRLGRKIDERFFFWCLAGYSFFDSGDVALLGRKKTSPFSGIGR